MPSATHDTPLLAAKGQPTAVNRAEERDHNPSSLSAGWAVTLYLSRAWVAARVGRRYGSLIPTARSLATF
jgi:hypothetical protein